jgi:hypothetical protein
VRARLREEEVEQAGQVLPDGPSLPWPVKTNSRFRADHVGHTVAARRGHIKFSRPSALPGS